MLYNNWMIYSEEQVIAHKRVEADIQRIHLLITPVTENSYSLAIEAGMDSVAVNLKSDSIEQACLEADQFAKAYFRDKAKLFEEIADRI